MKNEHWRWRPLGELFEIGAGKTMSARAREGANQVPFLRTSNVLWDEIDLTSVDTMALSETEVEEKGLSKGDLLVCEGGDIGRSAVWTGEVSPMSFQNHLHRLRPIGDDVDAHFYVYFLQSAFTQLGLFEGAGNKTTIPNLSRNRLAGLDVPHPPRAEQALVTSALSLIKRAIRVNERIIQASLSLRAVALKQLFTCGLRGEQQALSVVGPIPESWAVSPLESVASFERGRFLHRPRNEPRFYGGSTPFIQTGDVVRSGGRIREYRQTLNADGVAISRVFSKGTILITIAANIGYTGILEFDAACPDSLVAIQAGPALDGRFLEFYLRTQQPEMDRLAPKGTQKNINIQFLNPWPVVVPHLSEQVEIVEILAAIDRKVDIHQEKGRSLQDLFASLLHKLMTGTALVSELDQSALDVLKPTEVPA